MNKSEKTEIHKRLTEFKNSIIQEYINKFPEKKETFDKENNYSLYVKLNNVQFKYENSEITEDNIDKYVKEITNLISEELKVKKVDYAFGSKYNKKDKELSLEKEEKKVYYQSGFRVTRLIFFIFSILILVVGALGVFVMKKMYGTPSDEEILFKAFISLLFGVIFYYRAKDAGLSKIYEGMGYLCLVLSVLSSAFLWAVIIPGIYYKSAIYSKKSEKKDESKKEIPELELYEMALKEIESNNIIKGLWSKSLAETGGEENKAKAYYINHRVKDLKKIN